MYRTYVTILHHRHIPIPPSAPIPPPSQAKEALHHPYFDDLDRRTVDQLENPALQQQDEDW